MTDWILETWQLHNEINLFLLDKLPEGGLGATSASRGRSVGEQFVHMHGVRVRWMEPSAPDLVEGMPRFLKGTGPSVAELKHGLEASGKAVEGLLERSIANNRRIQGFKHSPLAWMGYLVSHESHHRGQIALALKQAGLSLSDEATYGLWKLWIN
jgi:uncharacterized damage-inducible protein DinB